MEKWDLLGLLSEVVARLGEERLHLREHVTVRGLCLRLVWGRSCGLVYYYCGLLRGPLCDLFGCVSA